MAIINPGSRIIYFVFILTYINTEFHKIGSFVSWIKKKLDVVRISLCFVS